MNRNFLLLPIKETFVALVRVSKEKELGKEFPRISFTKHSFIRKE